MSAITTSGEADHQLMAPQRSSRRWTLTHYLAAAGIPILVWETWTLTAWLTDNPHQITQFRDRDSASWYAARIFEGTTLLFSFIMIIYVLRGCFRARRFLTFDMMFILCGTTVFWFEDLGANMFVPTWLPSSNWTNLNAPCGHMPFVVNPDCGRAPDPLLFSVPLISTVMLGLAILVGGVIKRMQNRWPGVSTKRIVVIAMIGGFAFDFILEAVLLLPLNLWAFPAPDWMSIPSLGGAGFRFPVLELLAAGTTFFLMISLRIFKDGRGRTILERGLDRHSERTRTFVTMLGLYGAFQLIGIFAASAPLWLYGPLEEQWPARPAHIVNQICDAPGVTGTRYGPCPGSPGFRMPGRHSLPGESP